MGDEGSGAWLGLRAMQLAQAAMDGRVPAGALARALWVRCGSTPLTLLDWSLSAGQHAYAQLAPLVFEAAMPGAPADPQAERLLQQAADELAALAQALQPDDLPPLPLVLLGGVGERLASRLPAELLALRRAPLGDAIDGVLIALRARALRPASPAAPAEPGT